MKTSHFLVKIESFNSLMYVGYYPDILFSFFLIAMIDTCVYT